MQLSDFKVRSRFRCGGRIWMCTDVGKRTVAAVCLTVCRTNDWARALPEDLQDRAWKDRPDGESPTVDPSWLEGPPYALAEHVFDENDQKGCEPL